MQKKFILAPVKTFWLSWLHISKLAAVSMGILLFITAIAGTSYAVTRSVAGQTLFTLKKRAELLQLTFARSPEAKINLQLEISQKRLSEAQEVLKDPSVRPSQTTAVINELVTQTQNTVEEMGKVAKADPDPKKAQPMVKSLETLTSQQQQLIKEIKPANEQTMVAKAEKTTQETTTKLAEIKQYIQTASNDQALVDLKKEKDNLGATPGEVKSTSTDSSIESKTDNTNSTTSASSTAQTVKKVGKPEVIEKDPNTVLGTFIIEDPSPQFKP
jgi:hypothetical protein